MTQAQRIKQRRRELKLTQQELAQRVGTSRVAISHWENDPSIALTGHHLQRLSRALDRPTSWILYGSQPPADQQTQARAKLMEPLRTYEAGTANTPADYRLPILPVTASAGDGAVVFDEAPTAFMELPKQLLRDLGVTPSRSLRMISVRGDSMRGTLNHGDFAIIDTSVHGMQDDGVYVLNLDGQLLIKRLQRLPGTRVRVISDNPCYPHYEIDPSDNVRICGRFIGGWSFGRL